MKTLVILSLIFLFVPALRANAQNCIINCPSNIIVKADSGKGDTRVTYSTVQNSEACGVLTYMPATGSLFKVGSTSVIGTNSKGDRCSFTVMVTDNEAPNLSPLIFSVQKLWPASGKLKEVAVSYIAKDNGDSCLCSLSVTSNDPAGKRSWEIVNNHLIKLSASRLPDGTSKIYTVTATCTDVSGNLTKRSKTIAVAKNVAKKM